MDGTAAAAAIVAIPIRASFRFIRAIILYTEYETQLAGKRTNEFFRFINDDHILCKGYGIQLSRRK
jgi:hypothetical protein